MSFLIMFSKLLTLVLIDQFNAVLIDSSGNGYTLYRQSHECISYNSDSSIDALIIVNRDYSQTGNLNTHEAPGDLSAWVHYTPYQQELGPARYPSTLAGVTAYIVFPSLIGANWVSYNYVYEAGGWFSGFWSPPTQLPYAKDLIVLKQFSDSLLLAIVTAAENRICYILMAPVQIPEL